MSDSNHTITFNQVTPGTPGSNALQNFVGTSAQCPVCGTWVPITQSDVNAYIQAHGAPHQTDVFTAVVEHGIGPK